MQANGVISSSRNGLSTVHCKAIIWSKTGVFTAGRMGENVSGI